MGVSGALFWVGGGGWGIIIQMDGGGWGIILDGLGWVGHYFGWVGVSEGGCTV